MDDVADIGFIGFDGFGQFELNQGTLQIMLRMLHFEINISIQIIGKETDAQFKGQQPDLIKEIIIIGLGQEVAGLGKIALQNGRANFWLELDGFPILCFLSERVAS